MGKRSGRVAAIYARVSSDRQRREQTIRSQTAALRGLAAARDLLVVEDLVSQLSKLVAPVSLGDQLDHPTGAVRANTSATNDSSIGRMLLETAISKLRTGNLKPGAWISVFIVVLVAVKCGYFPEVSFDEAASVGRKIEGIAGNAIRNIHIRRPIP